MRPAPNSKSRALIVGGSAAGRLHALSLAKNYGEVVLIDKHDMKSNKPNRAVPQSDQINALAYGGILAMNAVSAEILQHIRAMGFESVDPGTDIRYTESHSWNASTKTNFETLYAPRRVFDEALRTAIMRVSNISILQGIVTGATIRESNRKVDVFTKNGPQLKDFDLVVLATGRSPLSFDFVSQAVSEVTETETVNLSMQTATYRFGNLDASDWKVIVIGESPSKGCRGSFAINFGETFSVAHGDRTARFGPTDHASLLAFAAGLPNKTIAAMIATSAPNTFGTTYNFSEAVHRRIEKARAFPPGILVVGDAHISTNPMYGLGMSLAAIGAWKLQEVMRCPTADPWSGLASRFYREMAETTALAWHLTSIVDRRLGANGIASALPQSVQWVVAAARQNALRDGWLTAKVMSNAQLVPFARKISLSHIALGALRGAYRPNQDFQPLRFKAA